MFRTREVPHVQAFLTGSPMPAASCSCSSSASATPSSSRRSHRNRSARLPRSCTFLDTHPLDWRFPVGVAMELVGLLALVVFAARLAGRIRAVTGPGSWTPAAVVSRSQCSRPP